jgi:hypothetical protein
VFGSDSTALKLHFVPNIFEFSNTPELLNMLKPVIPDLSLRAMESMSRQPKGTGFKFWNKRYDLNFYDCPLAPQAVKKKELESRFQVGCAASSPNRLIKTKTTKTPAFVENVIKGFNFESNRKNGNNCNSGAFIDFPGNLG